MPRIPEGQTVDKNTLAVFSRVARWGGRAAATRVKKIIGSHLTDGMTVLDIGTGPASIPIYLKRFFPNVSFTGLDISIGMLGKAKENRKILGEEIDLLAGDGETLPFRPKSIDVITSFFSLHHMDRPENLLNEIDRVLKSNGIFLSIDFRRDMPAWLFRTLNILWQLIFFFSGGRFGIRDSIQSAWRSKEINDIITQHNFCGFQTHTNLMELWVFRGLKTDAN